MKRQTLVVYGNETQCEFNTADFSGKSVDHSN